MSALPAGRLRCAVYTRKSDEDGLERKYNSIEAQRDAGQAMIASRRTEGWIPVADDYDDAGFSGGTLRRPALQRLLSDIRTRKIDIVVAYKLDRLARSMRDYYDIEKTMEMNGVRFFAVSEHIDTADAMGRMNQNIALTFAQYQREQTGERIRDKIVASKKKGMWMHGIPPLGYDLKDRRLAVLEAEAEQVRFIFQHLLETHSILQVVEALHSKGWLTKPWVTAGGNTRGSKPHDKNTVHRILHNRTYLGELKHRDQYFTGAHVAIVELSVWERVQVLLSANAQSRGNMSRGNVPFLLKGLVVGPDRRALTPYHTKKRNGRLYRYYISTRELKRGASVSNFPRLPASELEAIVLQHVRQMLGASGMLEAILPLALEKDPSLDEAQVVVAMRQFERVWGALFPGEQQRLIRMLVEEIEVGYDALVIRFYPNGVTSLVNEFGALEAAA